MAGFSLSGLQAVISQLDSIAEETQTRVLRSACRAAFKPVQDAAKSMVPVDSGELREAISIGSAMMPTGAIATGLTIVTTSGRARQARMAAAAFGEAQSVELPPSRRWHFIELGTAKYAPHPFLRPALIQKAGEVVEGLAREVEKKIINAVKKAAK